MKKNMYKVYYVDEVRYELKQLLQYAGLVRLTQSQRETVDLLISCNYNQNHAAVVKGVTNSTINIATKRIKNKIYKYLNENDITIKEAPYRELNIRSIVSWYETGLYSAPELSRVFLVPYGAIRAILAKSGAKSPTAERYTIRYTIEDVRAEFEKEGYTLITSHYNHQNDRLKYMCPEGHTGEITFQQWKHYQYRCDVCCERLGGGNYSLTRAERMKDIWLDTKGYIYLIKLIGENEEFYKIGITVNPKHRFSNFPYNVEVIKLYETNLYSACYVEDWLLKSFEDLSYTPKIRFGGETECFSSLPLNYKITKER